MKSKLECLDILPLGVYILSDGKDVYFCGLDHFNDDVQLDLEEDPIRIGDFISHWPNECYTVWPFEKFWNGAIAVDRRKLK